MVIKGRPTSLLYLFYSCPLRIVITLEEGCPFPDVPQVWSLVYKFDSFSGPCKEYYRTFPLYFVSRVSLYIMLDSFLHFSVSKPRNRILSLLPPRCEGVVKAHVGTRSMY